VLIIADFVIPEEGNVRFGNYNFGGRWQRSFYDRNKHQKKKIRAALLDTGLYSWQEPMMLIYKAYCRFISLPQRWNGKNIFENNFQSAMKEE